MSKSTDFANVFAGVMKTAAETAATEKSRIQEQIDAIEQQRKEAEKQLAELHKALVTLDEDIAVGLQHSARDAGIKINIGAVKKHMAAAAPKDDKILDAIVRVVPEGKSNAVTSVQIAKDAKLDGGVVSKAMPRLLRSKSVKKIGERRAKRYYR